MVGNKNPNLNKPTYSVIMLIFHRTQELVDMALECLYSIPIRKDQEIIIVDNGSTVRHGWENEDKCDVYIRLKENMGISHGWNIGLKASRGTYPIIIGDDIMARNGWIETMREAIEQPMAGMANPRVENLPMGQGIVENYKWPSGACFMLSRKTIEKVGYFDEDLYWPAQFEDADYWIRLMKAGFKIYTNYSQTIRHREGQTDNAPDISVHFEANKKRFLQKHGFDPIPYFYGEADINELLKRI